MRRSGVLLSLAAGIVVLAVVLTGTFWPDGSGGSSGSREAGGGSRAAAAAQGASAARRLDKLPGVHLSVAYAPGDGLPVTRGELTVTADGKATGTLKAPVAGKAAMAWSGDQLYLKGDNDFWAQQSPHYGHDLTSSGHWIAPEKRYGYYMLRSFGVNVGSLTPKSLASAVRQVTSDPSATQEDTRGPQGHRVRSYTTHGSTVVLTSEAPYRVVALGLSPSHAGPVESAAWHSHASTVAQAVDHRATPADDTDVYHNPYLIVSVPKPATDKETAAVRAAASEAADAAVSPASTAEEISSQGPKFTTTSNDPYLCTTQPCSYSFTVKNEGDAPGEATLHLSFPGVPDRSYPLGMLEPGESKQVHGTRRNVARPGQTVRHTDYAWIYSPAFYGPDPEVAKRLHARNLEPNDVYVATPLKPTVAKLLDLMTKHAATTDTDANDRAVKALQGADDRGQLPLLEAIADSGRLANPEDLAGNVSATDEIGNERVLQQVAHLLKTDPNAEVTYDGHYKVNGKAYKTDYIYTSSQGGRDIKRAVQVKTVTKWKHLGKRTRDGAEQLNGEGMGPGGKKDEAENAPPGFERVLLVNLEPTVGAKFYTAGEAGLEEFLQGKSFAQGRKNLCKPNGGGTRVDRLVIVNRGGTHVWTDLRKLGVHCHEGSQ